MNMNLISGSIIDLQNDNKFEKLASFGRNGLLEYDEMNVDIPSLLEKQAYADDSTYADPINRMFSIATPLETKISALYAEKCASLLDEDVVRRINDACRIYNIDLEVPIINKVASITENKEIMDAINIFEERYVDPAIEINEKYASATEYGNQLDVCLAARAYYATEPEDVEAIEGLAKIASSIEPEKMVTLLEEIDEQLGLATPHMQSLVGTPEYAVYEKVASENMVNLGGSVSVPLDVIEENKEVLASMGVDLDWDGENEDSLTLQIERLPSQIKEELASCCGKEKVAGCGGCGGRASNNKVTAQEKNKIEKQSGCEGGECETKDKNQEPAPEKAVKVEIKMDGDKELKTTEKKAAMFDSYKTELPYKQQLMSGRINQLAENLYTRSSFM